MRTDSTVHASAPSPVFFDGGARLAPIEHSGSTLALVIADEPIASAIAELYRTHGYDVFAPDTPLDAIQTLISAGDQIGVVLVSPETAWANGLREFLADEYPTIDQIVLAA